MRAREWAIVGAAREPEEHGIPELPAWRVSRNDDGGIAFADAGEPFILAESPVRVRR